jgi:hypothetical protein
MSASAAAASSTVEICIAADFSEAAADLSAVVPRSR